MLAKWTYQLCAGLFLFSSISLTKAQTKTKQEEKPNIIFILADDLGIGNVSCYGADHYSTPNIDKIAQKGIRFTHAYTAPLCGPSRALIMTGRYAFRTGAVNQDQTGDMLPEVETMMPTILKSAGYITSSVGKWGQLPLGPKEFGFDDYIRFKGSGVYWRAGKKSDTYEENGIVKQLGDSEYMPDLMHEHLKDFLIKNQNKPFYVYYPMSHVHAKIVRTPDSKPDSKDLFADNIAYMDKLVGKLVSLLDSLQLSNKTILLFFGDNGTGGGYADNSTIGGKRLIGQKGKMEEGGSLVPLIVYWPGKSLNGKVSSQLIDATDFFPTLASIGGAVLPNKQKTDGFNFTSSLQGKPAKEREWIFMQLGNNWYVRNAKWKLNQSGELFDMSGSPFEEKLVNTEHTSGSINLEKQKLQKVLDTLNPAGGIKDDGDGSGRHANKKNKAKKKKEEEE